MRSLILTFKSNRAREEFIEQLQYGWGQNADIVVENIRTEYNRPVLDIKVLEPLSSKEII